MEGRTAIRIAVLQGDGIGPEVTKAALRVVREALRGSGTELCAEHRPIGWAAVTEAGSPLPEETLEACRDADAVFLGAVGHPDAEGEPGPRRPETGLLTLRRELGCWANLRPVHVSPALVPASALRPEKVRGTDLVIVRELGGGIYYGEPRGDTGGRAWNTMTYTTEEVRRLAELALKMARRRRRRVTSVDKANVLEVSRLWRRTVTEVARASEGEVEVDHMLVDRAAMELTVNPTRFDVVLTANLFGDVLSDQAAGLAGSLGVLGSASLGGGTDLYEPVHGSAPELAGRGTANPMGALASFCLMLRTTFGLSEPARRIERAVDLCLAEGIRPADLEVTPAADPAADSPGAPVCTESFADAVSVRLPRSDEKA